MRLEPNREVAHGFLRTPEGLRLFYRVWEAESPVAVCLLAHGLGEHSGRYEDFARELRKRSLTLFALDHRGHGCSEGTRGHARSLAELVEDLDRLVDEAKRQLPALPRVLIGHSLGGLIALNYAARQNGSIGAVAVSSPALRLRFQVPWAKKALAHGLARLLPALPIPNGINPSDLCRDPEVARRYQSDPLVHHVVSACLVVAMEKAMAEAPAWGERLKIPCLVMAAGADKICDPAAAREFSQRVPASLVSFRRYEGLYHELFNEPERLQVIGDLCRWMEGVIRS